MKQHFSNLKSLTRGSHRTAVVKQVALGLAMTLSLGILFNAGQNLGTEQNTTVGPYKMVFMDRALGETAIDASAKACFAEIARSSPEQTGDLLQGADTTLEGVVTERCIRENQGILYTIADLDGDALADVASLSKIGKLTMSWNTGWGFRNVALPAMGSASGTGGQLLSGYVNDDEHVDIMLVSSDGKVSAAFGKGARTFSEPVGLGSFPATNAVTLADLNGDEHLDLVGVTAERGLLYVMNGSSEGLNGKATSLFSTGTPGISAMRPADLDRDGDIDLLTAGTGGMRVWENDKGQWFDITPGSPEDTRWVRDIALADVNGDGGLDLLTTGVNPGFPVAKESSYRMLWLRDGNSYRADKTPESLASGWGRSIAVTDLNLDGITDAVVASGAPAASKLDASWPGAFTRTGVLLGTGQGSAFVDGFSLLFRALHFNGSMSMVANADFDGDTRPDLFLSGEENAAPYVYLNRSTGSSALVSWEKPAPGDLLVVQSGSKQASYVTGGTSSGLHLGPLPVAVGLPELTGQVVLRHGDQEKKVSVAAGDHVRLTTRR
jgi:hypothetical protein